MATCYLFHEKEGLIANINEGSDITESLKKKLRDLVLFPNKLETEQETRAYANEIIKDIENNNNSRDKAVLAVIANIPIIYKHEGKATDKCMSDLLERLIARRFHFDMIKEYDIKNNLRL